MVRFVRQLPYTGPVRAVVLDWAGTAVDFGCMGPAAVFQEAFARHGVTATVAEAREPMGREKRDHVRAMLAQPGLASRWQAARGSAPTEADGDAVYADVEKLMVRALARYAEPVPGLLDFVSAVRRRDIRVGTCTGYTAPMIEVVAVEAARQGFVPDAIVSSSDVPAGRPAPWMCHLNAMRLGVYPMCALVKIGDTAADMEEGRNAGMWTVGVARTGNYVGLDQAGLAALPEAERADRIAVAADRLRAAGAHYVADSVADCLEIVEDIGRRLARGETPYPAEAGSAGKAAG